MHQYANYIQPALAKLLKEIRRKRHYTQERMAECLRISTRCYSNLELGKSRFSCPSLFFFFVMLTDAEVLVAVHIFRGVARDIDQEWDLTLPDDWKGDNSGSQ